MKHIATLIAALALTLLLLGTSHAVTAERMERTEELPEVPTREGAKEAYAIAPQLFAPKKFKQHQGPPVVQAKAAPKTYERFTAHAKTPLFILVRVLRH
jgi:hypothetical protein